MKKMADGLVVSVQAVRGRKRVNVIVQVQEPYQYRLVGQLRGGGAPSYGSCARQSDGLTHVHNDRTYLPGFRRNEWTTRSRCSTEAVGSRPWHPVVSRTVAASRILGGREWRQS